MWYVELTGMGFYEEAILLPITNGFPLPPAGDVLLYAPPVTKSGVRLDGERCPVE